MRSVHESEIQPLHTLILRTDNVIFLFLFSHRIPLPVANLVTPDIERLDKVEEHDVKAADAQENLVATAV